MHLLVSVRSAAEARVAGANGADIVDAKEPGAGPLGAVSAEVLGEILRALPDAMPLGIALGDMHTLAEVGVALDSLAPMARAGAVYLKLGLAGVANAAEAATMLRLAAGRARELGPSVSVVAAAYADYAPARSPSPDEVLAAAFSAGVAGVLLDTWTKEGLSLLHHIETAVLRDWVGRAHRGGLFVAVAGSLGTEAIPEVLAAEPDIIGVRGSVCQGGRGGTLDPARVRRLREALDRRATPVA